MGKLLKNILKIIFFLSLIVMAVSFFKKGGLPDKETILPQLYQEPLQSKTNIEPFEVEKGGITYTINPLFEYELWGMIVSENYSKSWFDYYHKKWNDHINIKDLCVIWGDNVKTEIYKKIEFSSGSWTCYYKFRPDTDRNDWTYFKGDAFSNNHLLSDNEKINETIIKAGKGDQIYLKGYLASYSHSGGFERGTSVARDDTGNGACETVFVTDFQIIKKAESSWHDAFDAARYFVFACLAILIILFFISVYRKR